MIAIAAVAVVILAAIVAILPTAVRRGPAGRLIRLRRIRGADMVAPSDAPRLEPAVRPIWFRPRGESRFSFTIHFQGDHHGKAYSGKHRS